MSTLTILILDDNEAIRRVMRIILRREGFRVLLAGTAEDALRVLRRLRDRIDLLVADIRLPAGFQLIDEAASITPGTGVLLMSCNFLEGDPEVADRAYIAKPFTHAALVSAIRSLIGKPADPPTAPASRYKTASHGS